MIYVGYRSCSVRVDSNSDNCWFRCHIVLDSFGFGFFQVMDHFGSDNSYSDTRYLRVYLDSDFFLFDQYGFGSFNFLIFSISKLGSKYRLY